MRQTLSVRETEFALLLCRGCNYQEIATRYKMHRNSIYHSLCLAKKKVGAKTVGHLIALVAVEDFKRKQQEF